MKHPSPHHDAGTTVPLGSNAQDDMHNRVIPGELVAVIDYWDRLRSRSWKDSHGDELALAYAWRNGVNGLPYDDEVLLCVLSGGEMVIVHVTELAGDTGESDVPALIAS